MMGMRNRYVYMDNILDKEDIREMAAKDIPNLLSLCERVIDKSASEPNKKKKRDDRDATR